MSSPNSSSEEYHEDCDGGSNSHDECELGNEVQESAIPSLSDTSDLLWDDCFVSAIEPNCSPSPEKLFSPSKTIPPSEAQINSPAVRSDDLHVRVPSVLSEDVDNCLMSDNSSDGEDMFSNDLTGNIVDRTSSSRVRRESEGANCLSEADSLHKYLIGDMNSSFDFSIGAFCNCYKALHSQLCTCGEDDEEFDWLWDENAKSWACYLQKEMREVRFHKHYSSGTACVRGDTPLRTGQHYWEIKMISPVYGTDMMIGVGTGEADLNRSSTTFCSFLGSDAETWGLSYTGVFHHDGKSHTFTNRFGQGVIIGVHLDTWKGILSFYKNRKFIGVACDGLKGKVLYPMVSSTAARSGIRLVKSCSFKSSLKFLTCETLRKSIPRQHSVLDIISLPPGLATHLQIRLSWLLGTPKCLFNHGDNCKGACHSSRKAQLFLENQIALPSNSSKIGRTENKNGEVGLSGNSRKQAMDSQDDDDDDDVDYSLIAKRRCFQLLRTCSALYLDSSSDSETDIL